MLKEENFNKTDDTESARVEYAAAQEAYLHYDNFVWQVGAVLIAGVFVYWGFLLATPPQLLVTLFGHILVTALMSVWLLYAAHNRQIYLFKLHRIHELEKRLGMLQHRRFKDWGPTEPRVYRIDKPGGHCLDKLVYVIVSLGGPLQACLSTNASEWSCVHFLLLGIILLLVAGVILRVRCLDCKTRALIEALDRSAAQSNRA
ncbi:MAG TPA: hypothetical protein ENI37_01175 [Chloroflexi bacterium]|nr:hypothetical protein [Chloroflexota bacterium]